jgi:predicted dehydrogenase
MMKNLKVGVIGVGYLGQFHAEKYAGTPEVELVGVVDADPARAALIAQKQKTQIFTDPAQLLGLIDAVSIVVPTAHHHRVAKFFLEQGVHVLLEKPITVTLEQADELIDLANRKGLILQVGHIERFNPAVTAVKTLLRSPRYMTAERAAPFTVRCTDVNVVLDLMIHDLDIVSDLAGSDPKEVSAAGASVITKEIDIATARIVFHNGCTADVTASRVSGEKKRLLRVFDEECIYDSDYQTQKASVSIRGGNAVPELIMSDISTERRDTLHEEIRAFMRSVQTGSLPLVSGIEGRRALALALKISENIHSGIKGFVAVK